MSHSLRLLSAVNTSLTAADHEDFHSAQSDYALILAALVCALICAIGLALVARCACLHRQHRDLEAVGGVVGHPPQPPPPGLTRKTLQLLPETKYVCGVGGSSSSSEKTHSDCAICLAEFVDGDLMRVLPQCGHIFHVNCIDAWLLSQSSCPSCRQLVLTVSRCHHCGGFSTARTDRDIDIDILSSQDNAHSFLP